MSNKKPAEAVPPSFPPPKTIGEFKRAIELVEDWIKELEASKALITSERTKTPKHRRHVKTRALKATTQMIEDAQVQLTGLRNDLTLVESVDPDSPRPPLPSPTPDSPLTQLGEDDAQGEPDFGGGEGGSSGNETDPSLKALGEGGGNSVGGIEEEIEGTIPRDDAALERSKVAIDAFHWNLYMQISALVDEDEETSVLDSDSLAKYMNDILLAIEGGSEHSDEEEEEADTRGILEGEDNEKGVWGWGVYKEARVLLNQYEEKGVLTAGDRSAMLRRLYDVICWDRRFVETREGEEEEDEQGLEEDEEDEEDEDEEEDEQGVEQVLEEEEGMAKEGSTRGKEKVTRGKRGKKKGTDGVVPDDDTEKRKGKGKTKGKEKAVDGSNDEKGEEEGEEAEEEEEKNLTREQIIAKRMSNAYNALCNAMTFEHDIPNGPRWDARRFAEMLHLYGTGSINIAMESFIVRKGLTRCHYHTLSDRTSKKNDHTREGVTGVHFKPTKIVSAPARNLRLIPDRLPGTIPRLRGAVEMPKEGPSGVNGLSYHELREFFPVTEKGRRQLHCGCDLQEALTDFFFWKGFPYISSFSKDTEELFGMPVPPRTRTWFCTILDALSVNVRDLYAYDKQGNRRTEEDIVKARIRRLWDTIAEDVEDNMVLRPKRPRPDVEDGNGDPGPSKRRK